MQITPKVEPTGWEIWRVITSNQDITIEEDSAYRVTCIGKCADGTSGESETFTGSSSSMQPHSSQKGRGGNGGATGGITRSILSLSQGEKITVTVTGAISSFGAHLSASAGVGYNTVGTASGGNVFNQSGNIAGRGGNGAYFWAADSIVGNDYSSSPSSSGQRVGSYDCSVTPTAKSSLGGSGGAGAILRVPDTLPKDDYLYLHTQRTLMNFWSGGGTSSPLSPARAADRYPNFDPANPMFYGGGSGGEGSCSDFKGWGGGAGSPGSPGAVLIEKAIY